jgi:hypothetical protein
MIDCPEKARCPNLAQETPILEADQYIGCLERAVEN